MSTSSPAVPGRLQHWRRALVENPIVLKELRSRMRGRRAYAILTLYLFFMSGLITLVYLAAVNTTPVGGNRQVGKAILTTVVVIEVLLVAFVGPAFTAGAISGEKERQTYDLLLTTLLHPRALVLGKLISALSYVVLLVVASAPLQSIAFLLGGVDWVELVLSQVVILTAAVTFALLGLYASARMRSTLSATVLTYLLGMLLLVGLPVIALLVAAVVGAIFQPFMPDVELILIYLGAIGAGLNLPATLIISNLYLVENGAVWVFQQTMSGVTVYLPSPWWLFVLFYMGIAWLLLGLTVRRVARL